jgi:hypothetical protein
MPMGGVASVEFRGDLIFIGVDFLCRWMLIRRKPFGWERSDQETGMIRSRVTAGILGENDRWRKLLIYAKFIAECAPSIASEPSCSR